MPSPRPFGRSLVPIAGESLPGFLLRLSFRLNLPPARVAELTGLATARDSTSRLPADLLTGIPEPGRRIFARATRLTDSQVTGLGLAAWQERYPLPAWMPGKGRRLPMDRWSLFAPATRYCPECLAGDGSPPRSHSAVPGSRPGTCPLSSPAPRTSGSWSTAAPNAARPSMSALVSAPPSRSCP
jgi:hypothetical protein